MKKHEQCIKKLFSILIAFLLIFNMFSISVSAEEPSCLEEHDYVPMVTDPTCTADGSVTFTVSDNMTLYVSWDEMITALPVEQDEAVLVEDDESSDSFGDDAVGDLQMFLSEPLLASDSDKQDIEYTVNVVGGTADVTTAHAGDNVTITANESEAG